MFLIYLFICLFLFSQEDFSEDFEDFGENFDESVEYEDEYEDEYLDEGVNYEAEETVQDTRTFNTRTFEGRIAKYYFNRQQISDEEWEDKIGTSFDEVYIIQEGDTLWDISEKFLDAPSFWPKIWALNPYITNPHLIYPGNEIRFKVLKDDFPQISIGKPELIEDDLLKNKNTTDYSKLELEISPSRFDRLGFYLPSLQKLKAKTYLHSPPYNLFIKDNIQILSNVYKINKNKVYSTGDYIHIEAEDNFRCSSSKTYSLINKYSNYYKYVGDIKIKNTEPCKALIMSVYGLITNKTYVVDKLNYLDKQITKNQNKFYGEIIKTSKSLNSEGDLILVSFDANKPATGNIVFFYDKNEIVGIGKITSSYDKYFQTLILASTRPINKSYTVATK